MATTRIKDLSKTATTVNADANLVLDGNTGGTQKITRDNFRQDTADAFVAAPGTYNLAPINSGTGKIDATYLPTSSDTPKGAWDASTNTPTLADGSGTAGDYYDVTVAGSSDLGSGSITFTVGDVVKYNGTTWFKIDSVTNILDGVSTIDGAKAAIEIPDVGTDPSEVPLNQHLGSMAYQSADSVAMGAVEVDSLDVGGQTKSGSLNVYDANGNASNSLDLTYNGSSGVANIQADSSGGNTSLTFGTSNAGAVGTRWSIDSSGSLVASSNGTGSRAASQPIVFYGTNSGSVQIDQGSIGTEAGTANSNAGELVFKASNSSGALTERFRVDEYGNIKLASGGAIDFGSGSTLSDYEEGEHETTATPSTSGSITLNASYDKLAYTKIGRSIIVTGFLKVSSVSSPVGTSVTVTLPTSTLDLGDFSGGFGAGAAYYNGSSWGPISCAAGESSNTLYLHVDASTVSANDEFRFSLCYQSA